MTESNDKLNNLKQNPFAVFAAVVLAVVTGLSLVFATDVFLLLFLGILFAVFLVQTTVIVQRFVPLSYAVTLGIVASTLFAAAVTVIVFSGSSIETQLAKTSEELSRSKEKVKNWLDENPHTMALIGRVPFAERVLNLRSDQTGAGKATNSADDRKGSLMAEIENAIAGDGDDTENNGEQSGDSGDQTAGQRDSLENGSTDRKGGDEGRSAESCIDATSNAAGSKEKTGATEATEITVSDTPNSENAKNGPSIPTPNLGKLSQQASSATGAALAGLGQFFSKTFGLLASLGLITFVGLFIAVDPALYRDGFVKLLPKHRRSRATEVMNKIGLNLFNWLNGRFIAMLITGLGTGIGLWVLGVPLAIVVGVVTALMTFVPNIGGFVALMLAMLMGLPQGPSTVVWIVVLYGTLQLIESNIITPLVQQQKTSIPPALLLAFQLLMGVLTGFLGLLVATPMLAGLMVLVKEVWIADVLGDDDIETPKVS